MQTINLPVDSILLWINGDHHAFVWRFFKRFGWFPDRDGSSINCTNNDWWIVTDQEIELELIQTIYTYCENPEVFQMPTTGEILQIDLNWADMMDKLNTYTSNDNTLDIQYIGHGPKQYIHFNRSLRTEEKIALKNLISNYINFL